ncbi:MAG: RNase adapter RapZ [Eubacteriales bacterium]|nr:RNase adapter RapZ [Eubacteriales bacterium]
MRFIIVSGMSGAGKSTALHMLEDMGFFCVDNLPVELLPNFGQIAYDRKVDVNQVAVTVDVRSGEQLEGLSEQLDVLCELGIRYEILFLDAEDRVLVKRYKETRRTHPLAKEGRVESGIAREREVVSFIAKQADYVIDTSALLTRELKQELEKIYIKEDSYSNFIVTFLSFGFKYGIPPDTDLVFDVRFLPNPYYDPELRSMTGDDVPVQDYVLKCPEAHIFLDKLEDMLRFLIPHYQDEGKYHLVVGIGCTGGKHRSVTMANAIYKRMEKLPYSVRMEHRDITNDSLRKSK